VHLPWDGRQVVGQALFFVGLFRKESREVILGWAEWVLPPYIPGLALGAQSPAQALHALLARKIDEFQQGVARRAAARAADNR
jgi:hypothetical protein